MSSQYKHLLLPTELKAALIEFQTTYLTGRQAKDKRTRNNLFSFFSYLIYKSTFTNGITCPTHCHCLTIRKHFGKKYAEMIGLLQAAGVLYINHKYVAPRHIRRKEINTLIDKATGMDKYLLSNELQALERERGEEGEAKEFTINQKLINDAFEFIKIPIKPSLRDNYIAEKATDKAAIQFFELMQKVSFDIDKAKTTFLAYLEASRHLNSPSIKYGNEVTKRTFRKLYFFCYKEYRMKDFCEQQDRPVSRKFVQDVLGKDRRMFIQLNKTCYYISRERFNQMRTLNVLYSYTHSMHRLYHQQVFAIREKKSIVNSSGDLVERKIRLHTSVTNLPSIFTNCLQIMLRAKTKTQNFVGLDLANSQFAILAHCLSNLHLDNRISKYIKSSGGKALVNGYSCQSFIKHARLGTLYEHVSKELKISRKEAKQCCFEVLFAPRPQDVSKASKEYRIIKSLFHDLVAVTDLFKARYGYKELSKELQFVEATIFIDTIHPKLQKAKIPVLTKHDAFLVPSNKLNKSKVLITNELDDILGTDNYLLRIEKY